ncbi:MAG: 4Fe-4S dicluster domain-containing protein, partial [Candidatus Bathyarchaeia archaeon]
MSTVKTLWIARDYKNCSGCRRCEVACSLHHEKRIWPEASRIRVFMLVPGVEFPHLCSQCVDYPCVKSCPYDALSVNPATGAVIVDKEKCTACGACIQACPGTIPHLHPDGSHVLICDLCGGDPECVRVCQEGRWDALRAVGKESEDTKNSRRLYARKPREITQDLTRILF